MKNLLIYTAIVLLLSGCELKQKDYIPRNDFIKIYNDTSVTKRYYPAGIIQTEDNGYLILSGIVDESTNTFPSTELIKVSDLGALEWFHSYPFVAPAKGIVHTDNTIGFVAMQSDNNRNGNLVTIDILDGEIIQQYDLDITMPLGVYNNEEKMVVLGFDFNNVNTTINMYNVNSFQRTGSTSLNVSYEETEDRLLTHMDKTGEIYPFFIGEWSNEGSEAFYVNCWENYSVKTIFINENGSRMGDIYSHHRYFITSIIQKRNNIFALTRFYEENIMVPEVEVNINGTQNFNDIGFTLPELAYKAKVYAKHLINESDTSIIFASTTNRNSLQVYQYGIDDDELLNSFEIGFDESIDIEDMIITGDNGIAVLGRFFVLGKYPRPLLVKIPPEKLK